MNFIFYVCEVSQENLLKHQNTNSSREPLKKHEFLLSNVFFMIDDVSNCSKDLVFNIFNKYT